MKKESIGSNLQSSPKPGEIIILPTGEKRVVGIDGETSPYHETGDAPFELVPDLGDDDGDGYVADSTVRLAKGAAVKFQFADFERDEARVARHFWHGIGYPCLTHTSPELLSAAKGRPCPLCEVLDCRLELLFPVFIHAEKTPAGKWQPRHQNKLRILKFNQSMWEQLGGILPAMGQKMMILIVGRNDDQYGSYYVRATDEPSTEIGELARPTVRELEIEDHDSLAKFADTIAKSKGIDPQPGRVEKWRRIFPDLPFVGVVWGRKKPARRGYLDESKVRQWMRDKNYLKRLDEDQGIALLLTDRHAVIDLDRDEDIEKFAAKNSWCRQTQTTRGGRGEKYSVRIKGEYPRRVLHVFEGKEHVGEFRGAQTANRIFRQVLTADPEEVEKERDEVGDLLTMAEALKHHNEAKFNELLTVLDTSGVIRQEDEKLVIFTEHRDTLDNLKDRLTKKGYTVSTIHGGMDVDARKQAQREFRNRSKIMVATDAAGEGINLQFCRFLINWDIPWNPNRLEQRMGRVHRYGQEGVVWVYNLVATNTREGAVLQRVLSKLDVMREQLGNDRVYDVIQELLEDVPLVKLVEKSIDDENGNEAAEQLDNCLRGDLNQRAENLIALQKKQSLASHLDLRSARDLRDASDERRLQPLFIQNFFLKAYRLAGGTVNDDKNHPVYHVGRTPTALMEVARQLRLSVAEKYDTPFVFDKNLVSVASRVRVPEFTKLLGPGHPLFDTVIEWAIRHDPGHPVARRMVVANARPP